MISTSLRLKDDIHDLMVNDYCKAEDVSMNKMINTLLAEALNARELNSGKAPKLINPKTGKYEGGK